MPTYRSGRALAYASIALVSIYTLVMTVFTAAALQYLATSDVQTLTRVAVIPEHLPQLLYLSAGIVFLTWVHRAVANLHVLGQYETSPSAAVWAFIIPFVNLWRPHAVMATVWTESQPAAMNENGYSLKRPTTLVTAWWLTFVATSLFSRYTAMQPAPTTLTALHDFVLLGAIEGVLWVFAGVMFVWMVSRTQSRQDAQWEDMELRRNAPKPDPMALR